jgi:hypothetical protein
MKTIQTTSLILILGCFLVVQFACESDYPKLNDDRDHIDIVGQMHSDDYSMKVNDRTALSKTQSFINSNGIVLANGADLKLTSKHTHITYREDLDNVQIERGYFEYTLDNGDMVFGTYSGCGAFGNGNVCVDLSLNISGGYGKYHDAAGSLHVTLNPDGNLEVDGLSLDVNGAISLPKKIAEK